MAAEADRLEDELFDTPGGLESLLDFLQSEGFDGLLYWNLREPDEAWVSAGFTRLLGYDRDEVDDVPTWWRGRVVREDLPSVVAAVEDIAGGVDRPYDQVVRYHHRDGHVLWVRARGVVLRDEDGRAQRLLGLHTDVTRQMRSEAALVRANETLRRFSSTVAHDLRAPLASIHAVVGILRGIPGAPPVDEQQAAQLLDRLGSIVERASTMVGDLVEFATSATEGAAEDDVPLRGVLAAVLDDVQATPHGAAAHVEVGDLDGITVVGNAAALRAALGNLVDNACKHTRPGNAARVVVTAVRVADVVELRVTDDGPGIPEHERSAVFRLGRRGADTAVPGSGVGLAAVRTLLAQMGGTITAQPGPDGAGTSMLVRLQSARPATDRPMTPALPTGLRAALDRSR